MAAKLCFIDLETTGTDPKQNGIIQIAAITSILEGTTLEQKDVLNVRVKPLPSDKIEDAALAVTGVTRQALAGDAYADPTDVHNLFEKFLGAWVDKFDKRDKFFFVGYNARFDYDFLRAFFEKCGNKYFGSWFWFPAIDVMGMAAVRLMVKRNSMANFKLATVAGSLGVVPEGEYHDALNDIALTQKLFTTLLKGEQS